MVRVRQDQMISEMFGGEVVRKLYCACACVVLLACTIPVFPLVVANFVQVRLSLDSPYVAPRSMSFTNVV